MLCLLMIDGVDMKDWQIENIITLLATVACVLGLAALTDGSWGWGFLILLNINSPKAT